MLHLRFYHGAIKRVRSTLFAKGNRSLTQNKTAVARCVNDLNARGQNRHAGPESDRACPVEHGVWAAFVHLGHGGPVIRP